MPDTNLNTAANVTTGKPKVTGAMFFAPLGTAIPMTAAATLDAAYQCLGYVSEDGVTDTISRTTTPIKEWGGSTVYEPLTDFSDVYKYKLIEGINANVLAHVFGSSAVTGTLASVLALAVGAASYPDQCILIIDTIHRGYIKRQVLPCAQVAEIGDIVYKGTEPVAFALTTKALADASGHTHYDYTQAAS